MCLFCCAGPDPADSNSLHAGDPDPVKALMLDIEFSDYRSFYSGLRQLKRKLKRKDAKALCIALITEGRTPKALDSLLEHCPSVSQMDTVLQEPILSDDIMFPSNRSSLVSLAAAYDRKDLLDLLLRRGFAARGKANLEYSPLETAFLSHHWRCLERLLQEPSLDIALTPAILMHWADYRPVISGRDFQKTIGRLAARMPQQLFYPQKHPSGIPLPRALTLDDAIRHQNPWLFCSLCGCGAVPDRAQAKRMLECLQDLCRTKHSGPDIDFDRVLLDIVLKGPNALPDPSRPQMFFDMRALLVILRHHPTLLRTDRARSLVVRYYLMLAPQVHGQSLDLWIGKLQGKTVPLDLTYRCKDARCLGLFLARWKELLPDGPAPSINAWSTNWRPQALKRPDEILALLLEHCKIVRKRNSFTEIGWMAEEMLRTCAPHVVQAQLQPGGLLWGEDPKLLLRFYTGTNHEQIPAANRAVLAAFLKSDERYAL